MNDNEMFPMHDGPWLPWRQAEQIYKAFERLYSYDGISMRRVAQQGGFSYKEVPRLFSELHKRDRALWVKIMLDSGREMEDIRAEERHMR